VSQSPVAKRERPGAKERHPAKRRITAEQVSAITIACLLGVLPWAASDSFEDRFAAPKQALLFGGVGILLLLAVPRPVRLPRSRAVVVSMAGFAAWISLASVLSEFPRESILGWYDFRIGWTTWLAATLLFFAISSISRDPALVPIVRAGAFAGLLTMSLMALGQQTGAADVLSSMRMATRNTGLAGTPNDLAACCIVYLGFLWPVHQRPRLASIGVATATLAVFLSVSRAGVVLFIVTIIFTAVLGCLALGWRKGLRDAAWLGAAFVVGFLLAVPTSTPAQLIGRFENEIPADTPAAEKLSASGGPRLGFWGAGVEAVLDRPVLGHGADSLAFVYGRYRDDSATLDLYHDMAIASSHSSAIDIAIAGGVPALVLLASGIAFIVGPRLRTLRREPESVLPLAALAGFGAMSLLNPLAIPQLAGFAALLGLLTPSTAPRWRIPRPVQWSFAGAVFSVAVVAFVAAVMLWTAESRAADARDAAIEGDYERSVALYRSAADVLPIERHYPARIFVSSIDAASYGGSSEFDAAIRAGEDLRDSFPSLAGNLVALAGLIQMTNPGDPRVEVLLAEARALEPASQRWAESIARIRTLGSPTPAP